MEGELSADSAVPARGYIIITSLPVPYIAVCTILVEVGTLVVTASHFSVLVRRVTR